MKVKEIMSQPVIAVKDGTSLAEAARIMKDNNIGVLPVIAEDKVQGLITDRDIVLRAVSADKDVTRTKVGEIVTKSVVTCRDQDDIETAAQQIADRKVNRLLVINETDNVVGLLSLGDLAFETADPALIGNVLTELSRRSINK